MTHITGKVAALADFIAGAGDCGGDVDVDVDEGSRRRAAPGTEEIASSAEAAAVVEAYRAVASGSDYTWKEARIHAELLLQERGVLGPPYKHHNTPSSS